MVTLDASLSTTHDVVRGTAPSRPPREGAEAAISPGADALRLTDDFRSGDILAFGGRGLFSRAIRVVTFSRYTHVAIICERAGVPLLFESTKLSDLPCVLCGRPTKGVQAVLPTQRIAAYDGAVWQLRLRRPLEDYEIARLLGFLVSQDHVSYGQIGRASLLGRLLRRSENWQHWFCSKIVIAALQELRSYSVLEHPRYSHPSAWSPKDVVKRLTAWRIYEMLGRVR